MEECILTHWCVCRTGPQGTACSHRKLSGLPQKPSKVSFSTVASPDTMVKSVDIFHTVETVQTQPHHISQIHCPQGHGIRGQCLSFEICPWFPSAQQPGEGDFKDGQEWMLSLSPGTFLEPHECVSVLVYPPGAPCVC